MNQLEIGPVELPDTDLLFLAHPDSIEHFEANMLDEPVYYDPLSGAIIVDSELLQELP